MALYFNLEPSNAWYESYEFSGNASLMIDHRIILQILHSHLLDCSGALRCENKDWVGDDKLIIFPAKDYNYQERVDELNAVQYLQRTRILYMTFLRSN